MNRISVPHVKFARSLLCWECSHSSCSGIYVQQIRQATRSNAATTRPSSAQIQEIRAQPEKSRVQALQPCAQAE